MSAGSPAAPPQAHGGASPGGRCWPGSLSTRRWVSPTCSAILGSRVPVLGLPAAQAPVLCCVGAQFAQVLLGPEAFEVAP